MIVQGRPSSLILALVESGVRLPIGDRYLYTCDCACVSAVAARFSCEHSKVSVGERNVCLKCEVRAQPRLTALFWVIDDNGTTVYEGEVVDRYWTLILVRY